MLSSMEKDSVMDLCMNTTTVKMIINVKVPHSSLRVHANTSGPVLLVVGLFTDKLHRLQQMTRYERTTCAIRLGVNHTLQVHIFLDYCKNKVVA
jgi:hypothetical protein